eukprot:255352_1
MHSIMIESTPVNELKCVDEHLHLLPCEVQHNGPAKVDSYFKSQSAGKQLNRGGIHGSFETVSDKKEESSNVAKQEVSRVMFRGHELLGGTVDLPSSTRGFVLKESGSCLDDDNTTWKVSHKFSKFTVWNRDSFSDRKVVGETIDEWFDIAHAVLRTKT